MELSKYGATGTSTSVNLGDAGSFTNEKALATDRFFGFSVINATGAPQKVILTPSYIPSNANLVIRDGAIPYSAGHTDLTAASTGSKTIFELLEFIKFHPARINFLQIKSDNTSQLDQSITIARKSIFGDPKVDVVPLTAFQSPNYLTDKLIIVKRDHWQLDYDQEVSLNIPGFTVGGNVVTVTTTFTWYFGAIIDHAAKLYKEAITAQ